MSFPFARSSSFGLEIPRPLYGYLNKHINFIVARIAQDILERESPETLKKCEKLLQYYKDFNPTFMKAEGDHIFVEAAQFADMIKYNGGMYQ